MCWTSRTQMGENLNKSTHYPKYPLQTQLPFPLSPDKTLNRSYSFWVLFCFVFQFLLDIIAIQFNVIFWLLINSALLQAEGCSGTWSGTPGQPSLFPWCQLFSQLPYHISTSFTPMQSLPQSSHSIREGCQESKENQKKKSSCLARLLWPDVGVFWLWYSQGWSPHCTISSWVIYSPANLFLFSSPYLLPLKLYPQLLTALVCSFWQAILWQGSFM